MCAELKYLGVIITSNLSTSVIGCQQDCESLTGVWHEVIYNDFRPWWLGKQKVCVAVLPAKQLVLSLHS